MINKMPTPALVLGVGGLLPFIGLALLTTLAPMWYAYWLNALTLYGAVILSFVGALHWGFAVRRNARGTLGWMQYGWSVLPALVAWASLQLPVWTGLRVQAAMLIACLVMDRVLARADPVPSWLMQLRAVLTIVATIALLGASFI
ncbi:MAG: DUF3429 domain-containing protein [Betaproteobacteria bacterium]